MLSRSLLLLAALGASGAFAQTDAGKSDASSTPSPSTTPAPTATPTYACNPAHSYPNGYTCVVRGSSLTLVGPVATGTGGGGGGGNGSVTSGGGGGVNTPTPTPAPIATGGAPAHLAAPAFAALLVGAGVLFL